MKTYTLFWLDGKTEIIKGYTIADAFTRSGYGGGAMPALDFWSVGDCTKNYVWNSTTRNWEMTPEERKKFMLKFA